MMKHWQAHTMMPVRSGMSGDVGLGTLPLDQAYLIRMTIGDTTPDRTAQTAVANSCGKRAIKCW